MGQLQLYVLIEPIPQPFAQLGLQLGALPCLHTRRDSMQVLAAGLHVIYCCKWHGPYAR